MLQKLLLAVTMTLALNLCLKDRIVINTQNISNSELTKILSISQTWQPTHWEPEVYENNF